MDFMLTFCGRQDTVRLREMKLLTSLQRRQHVNVVVQTVTIQDIKQASKQYQLQR